MPHKDIGKRREYQKEYQQEWRKNNKILWGNILKKSKNINKNKESYQNVLKDVRKRRLHRMKTEVLELYGKECNYCGTNKYEVLCIDHINDDGKEHRSNPEYKRYSNMWMFLSKTEYCPDKYQTLCWNCNMAKNHYRICPEENDYKPFDYWKILSKKKNGGKK